MLIDRGGQLPVALGGLRSGHRDLDPDSGKTRPHAVVEAEEPTDVEVAFHPHRKRVELDAELLSPEPVGR